LKKDDEVPVKRGRGRPPKSGASGGKKSSDKPKVYEKYFIKLICVVDV